MLQVPRTFFYHIRPTQIIQISAVLTAFFSSLLQTCRVNPTNMVYLVALPHRLCLALNTHSLSFFTHVCVSWLVCKAAMLARDKGKKSVWMMALL